LKDLKITVACDVDNPLTGPRGASSVYGPQKGATPEMINQLDQGLANFANIVEKELNKPFRDIPGAGAAGGLGAGLIAFLSADLQPGVDIVIEAVHFQDHMKGAALVITGEGRIDSQTIYGKTPIGVAKAAKKNNVPVIAIAGAISEDSNIVHNHGIDALFSIVPGVTTLANAFENAAINMEQTARNIAATMKLMK
jgi:glycerate 2-kinase